MAFVYVFGDDRELKDQLFRCVRDVGAGLSPHDGIEFDTARRWSDHAAAAALVPWSAQDGWAVQETTMERLRSRGMDIIAVVPEEQEEEAFQQLDNTVYDIVCRTHTTRVRRVLNMYRKGKNVDIHRHNTLNATPGLPADAAAQVILIFDESGTLLYLSQNAKELFDAAEGRESTPEDCTNALSLSSVVTLARQRCSEVNGEGEWRGDLVIDNEHGKERILRSEILRLHDAGQASRVFVLRCRLTTTRKDVVAAAGGAPVAGAASFMDNLKGITWQRSVQKPDSLLLFGAVKALTGYDAGEFLDGSVTWSNILHPDDRSRMNAILRELMQGVRKSFDEIYRIIDRTGQVRILKDIAGRWMDNTNEDVVISGLALEMTAERDIVDRIALSEMMYRNLWEMEADALFLIERETGRIFEVNGAACGMYGYTRAELLQRRNVDLSAEPESTHAATNSDIRDIPVRWHRKKDGTVFPVEIHATHFIWNERNVHLAAIRDISGRLKQEALLRDAEIRYRTFFKQSPDGIVVLDPVTLLPREFNTVAHQQLEYGQEEFAHTSLRDMFIQNDVQLDEYIAQVLSGGRKDFRALFRKKGGRHADMDVTFVHVHLQDHEFLYGIMRDVTARRLAEDNLRTLSRAVDQSPSMIVITDADGIIEYVNPRFSLVTGYGREEVIGRSPRILKSGESGEQVYTELWRTLSAGEEWRGELRNRKRNGDLYWALVSISPVTNGSGRTQHFVAVQEDITAAKQIQLELIEAKERAERSDHLKDAFIANMSHEIRTPLNIILGFVGLLKDMLAGAEDESVSVCIENIERGGARLLRTVEEILNFSSIQAGTFPVNPDVLSVDQQVGLIVTDFIAHAREKGLSLEFRSGCDGVSILADSYAFGQALSNLLDNAIKFTHTGQVTVLSARCDQSILIEVCDTGVGIAEEYLPRLFESFSQEHSGKSRPFEGLGLGMALTKRYVEMCHGRIEVDSEKGKGTRFTIVFPSATSPSS